MNTNDLISEIDKIIPVKERTDNFPKDVHDILEAYKNIINKIDVSITSQYSEWKNTINTIKNINRAINGCIDSYYKGLHSKAYGVIKEYILPLILAHTDSYTVKKGDLFYKARIFENNRHRTYNEMFHISLNNRGIVRTQRYSFPGYPCLYLGSTIYSCWEEMDQPKFDDMMVSQFTASRDFLLFDLRKPNQLDFEQNLEKTLVRLPMVIACSLRVKHQKDNYKPEYIIPQLLIEYIIEQNRNLYNNEGKDLCELQIGVIYTSSRINNDMEFPKRVFDNIAIPVFNTDGEYCQVLASCFSWTDPTCYEYENLKKRFEPRIFHIDNDREEENYKCSKMGELEERLSSFEKKAFLHSVFTRTSIVLNQSGDPEDNGILCNTQYTIT
jgi:hypothetical protein